MVRTGRNADVEIYDISRQAGHHYLCSALSIDIDFLHTSKSLLFSHFLICLSLFAAEL